MKHIKESILKIVVIGTLFWGMVCIPAAPVHHAINEQSPPMRRDTGTGPATAAARITLWSEDTFTNGNWYLADYAEPYEWGVYSITTKDTYITGGDYADTNYGGATQLLSNPYVIGTGWTIPGRSTWLGYPIGAYLLDNVTVWGTVYRNDGAGDSGYSYIYFAPDTWTEYGLTKNNQPGWSQNPVLNLGTTDMAYNTFSFSSLSYPITGSIIWYLGGSLSSKEGNNPAYFRLVHSKIYQSGTNGYVRCQANRTETLTLRSPQFPSLSLRPTDTITINFQTTSSHQINYRLLNGGSTLASLELSPEGNTNNQAQTKIFTLGESFTADQMDFTGGFNDIQYFRVNSIQITGDRTPPSNTLRAPGEDITQRNFTTTPPEVLAESEDDTDGSGLLNVTATINGHAFKLSQTTEMSGRLYALAAGYGGAYSEWADFWANDLPDGAYLLDVCARDIALNERHVTRQIYKMVDASSWIPLYEMNLTTETWGGSGGTFAQTESEISIQAGSAGTLNLTSPAIAINSADNLLHPYDRVMVQYQTDTGPANPISLCVANDGVTQCTFEFTAPSAGVETRVFPISTVIPVDQLNFTGYFQDSEILRVFTLTILRPQTYKPELNVVQPSLEPSPTLEQLADRVFGNASAPGSARGIGGIPVIAAMASDVDSTVGSVTATIEEDYVFYMTLFDGTYQISLEANATAWLEWSAFWNAVGPDGQYLRGEGEYNLTITVIDSINVWPTSEGRTSASALIYRDLTKPTLEVEGIASGQGFAWNESWSEVEKVFPSVTLNADDPVIGTSFSWLGSCVGYTFEALGGLANPLAAHWIVFAPFEVPKSFAIMLNSDADTDGFADWEELEEGPVDVSFAVIDCGGNLVLQTVSIIKDCHVPVIALIAPTGNAPCTAAVPSFSLSITESYLTRVQYALGANSTAWFDASFTHGSSVTSIQQIFDVSAWASVIASTPEVDNFAIKFQVTDLAGQVVVTYARVNIDALAPRLKLLNPEGGTKAAAEAPAFLFEYITDPNLEEVYYTLSGSDTKHYLPSGTISGQIEQSPWDLALNKTVTIIFYAKDSFGNIASLETTVTRTDYVGPGDNENPGFFNFFEASPEVWAILGGVAAVTLAILSAYYRALKKRVPKIPPEDLMQARIDEQNGGFLI